MRPVDLAFHQVFHRRYDPAQRHFQPPGDAVHILDAYVSFAALDAPDVRPVDAANQRKFFLRNASFLPELLHRLAKGNLWVFWNITFHTSKL